MQGLVPLTSNAQGLTFVYKTRERLINTTYQKKWISESADEESFMSKVDEQSSSDDYYVFTANDRVIQSADDQIVVPNDNQDNVPTLQDKVNMRCARRFHRRSMRHAIHASSAAVETFVENSGEKMSFIFPYMVLLALIF